MSYKRTTKQSEKNNTWTKGEVQQGNKNHKKEPRRNSGIEKHNDWTENSMESINAIKGKNQ